LRLLLAAVVTLVGCVDQGEFPLGIAIDACAVPAIEVDGVVVGGTNQCGVGFAESAVGQDSLAVVTITNISRDARQLDVLLEDDGDGTFAVGETPIFLAAGLSAQLSIRARPRVTGRLRGALIISSEGEQNAGSGSIGVVLDVTAVFNGLGALNLGGE
jgi:hypothetical protein